MTIEIFPGDMVREICTHLSGTDGDCLRRCNKLFSMYIKPSNLWSLELLAYCFSRDFLLFKNLRNQIYIEKTHPYDPSLLKRREGWCRFSERLKIFTQWGKLRIHVNKQAFPLHDLRGFGTKEPTFPIATITIWIDDIKRFSFKTKDSHNFYRSNKIYRDYKIKYEPDILTINNRTRSYSVPYIRKTTLSLSKSVQYKDMEKWALRSKELKCKSNSCTQQ